MLIAERQGKGEMAFHEQLNDSLTKERGGRHGGKGHEFQRYWALCHLLKLDLEHDDYLILLEFIEDVAVLDAEHAPASMELFQLKKKEGKTLKWTKAALTKVPKDGKSILAKLFESKGIIANGVRSIAFVSNAPMELKLANEEDSTARMEFFAEEIDDDLKSALRKSIAPELGCEEHRIDFDNLKFIRTALAMDDLESHSFGKVAAYLAEKFPDHGARADVLCRALYSEIKVKATATEDSGSFEELKKIRGISKTQFTGMLSLTLSRRPDGDIVNTALTNLAQENIAFIKRESIKKAARRFLVDKAGRGSESLDLLIRLVDDFTSRMPGDLVTSWDVANWVVDQINSSDQASMFLMLEREYLLAVVLYRINQ